MIFSEHMQGQLLLSEMNVKNSLLVSDCTYVTRHSEAQTLYEQEEKHIFYF